MSTVNNELSLGSGIKIRQFSGDIEAWPKWKEIAEAAFEILEYGEGLTPEGFPMERTEGAEGSAGSLVLSAASKAKNKKLFALLRLSISQKATIIHSKMNTADHKNDGHKVWQYLVRTMEADETTKADRVANLYIKLADSRMDEHETAELFITELDNICNDLSKLGEEVSEELKYAMLKRRLVPTVYSAVLDALRVKGPSAQTYQELCAQTVSKQKDDTNIKSISEGANSAMMAAIQDTTIGNVPKTVYCRNCGQPGHRGSFDPKCSKHDPTRSSKCFKCNVIFPCVNQKCENYHEKYKKKTPTNGTANLADHVVTMRTMDGDDEHGICMYGGYRYDVPTQDCGDMDSNDGSDSCPSMVSDSDTSEDEWDFDDHDVSDGIGSPGPTKVKNPVTPMVNEAVDSDDGNDSCPSLVSDEDTEDEWDSDDDNDSVPPLTNEEIDWKGKASTNDEKDSNDVLKTWWYARKVPSCEVTHEVIPFSKDHMYVEDDNNSVPPLRRWEVEASTKDKEDNPGWKSVEIGGDNLVLCNVAMMCSPCEHNGGEKAEFAIDSGCTGVHMTPYLSDLSDAVPTTRHVMEGMNGAVVRSEFEGTVKAYIPSSRQCISIRRVVYFPGCKRTLLSVSQLKLTGWTFDSDTAS
jgi:hypothetical protein